MVVAHWFTRRARSSHITPVTSVAQTAREMSLVFSFALERLPSHAHLRFLDLSDFFGAGASRKLITGT
jgi:hypothetical protein